MVQVLARKSGPVSIAYVPCGPTLRGDHARLFPAVLSAVDATCRDLHAVTLIMEPSQKLDLSGSFKDHGFARWANAFQPREVMVVPADGDASMLARMHHKTRYHVRLAERQGHVVRQRPADPRAIAEFHALHAETAIRNGIAMLPREYFSDLLAAFCDHAELLISELDGKPSAGVLLARFGHEATYLFAGSTRQHRGQGAGALMVYRALQWARDHGCSSLDLGSVTSHGLMTFKSGFGGTVASFPSAMERRYHPFLAFAARRYVALRSL